MDTNKLGMVECLDKDEVAYGDEGGVAYLDEVVLAYLDNNNKDDLYVYFSIHTHWNI